MSRQHEHVNVIGAGLAGCEAAWQIAKRGIKVKLFEMKPKVFSSAHKMGLFAELVCSNSFRSNRLENAVGLLKEEMRLLDSIIVRCADETRIPAGGALAVDRENFSRMVTGMIKNNPNIEFINEEVVELPEGEISVVATGPLTSEKFSKYLSAVIGEGYLYFYDAVAPIITYESIDMSKAFKGSRYNRGTQDYINCPMDNKQYRQFWEEIIRADVVELKEFEDQFLFEGCMPIESIAKRGIDTMRFGPLKPVGLIDPHTGKEPYAVVQLRQDNKGSTLYNMVGFQTRLKWAEQKRVFSLIPGLENAKFVRYGVMHRNTFINSPRLLDFLYCLKKCPNIFFAGQITGVEGYVESASSGLVAGINAAAKCLGKQAVYFPPTTATGALSNYISNTSINNFQPMNINYGLMEASKARTKNKREKNLKIAYKALEEVKCIIGMPDNT